ncbi:MAG: type II toxin-antitoxin system HicB family antitoxin [Planctomycetes bacterium]|nr:type II toxin-antitoxin system HicB family antitoxin [Planctomycetota bacterium]
MNIECTAVIQHRGKWWIGWVEEVPGVNSQARTRPALLSNLRSALREAIELHRKQALEGLEIPAP